MTHSRRDFLNYCAVAVANIAAFSTFGYATSRAPETVRRAAGIPPGGPAGVYGDVINWPIIAIHAVLLPSGAVMSFGTDQSGNQGGFIQLSPPNAASLAAPGSDRQLLSP
jgi:hypothetical protein